MQRFWISYAEVLRLHSEGVPEHPHGVGFEHMATLMDLRPTEISDFLEHGGPRDFLATGPEPSSQLFDIVNMNTAPPARRRGKADGSRWGGAVPAKATTSPSALSEGFVVPDLERLEARLRRQALRNGAAQRIARFIRSREGGAAAKRAKANA